MVQRRAARRDEENKLDATCTSVPEAQRVFTRLASARATSAEEELAGRCSSLQGVPLVGHSLDV